MFLLTVAVKYYSVFYSRRLVCRSNIGVNEDTHDTSMMETFLRAMGRNWSDVATDAEDREYMKICICCCILLSSVNMKKSKTLY